MSMSDTETCYEYFDCKEHECARRNFPEKQCWEIDHVKCGSHSKAFTDIKNHFKSKLDACKICMYYQVYN